MPIGKGDQFYGYIAVWDGYPFSQGNVIPIQSGSCIVDGNHAAQSTSITIKNAVSMTTGDMIIINNIAYLILDYDPTQIIIDPGLFSNVWDGTIGSVIASAYPPTTFKTVEQVDVPIEMTAKSIQAYTVGALEITIEDLIGTPEKGQYLIIGGSQYLIIEYASNIITIDNPGLIFPIIEHKILTQTRNQQILIDNRVGEIYLNDLVRFGDYIYQIIAYQETPENITIKSPGVQESIEEDTMGIIYH